MLILMQLEIFCTEEFIISLLRRIRIKKMILSIFIDLSNYSLLMSKINHREDCELDDIINILERELC
mgnify:CR=1 FL=1